MQTYFKIVAVIAISVPLVLKAQDSKIGLDSYFNGIRDGKNTPVPPVIIGSENSNSTLNDLSVFYNDTSSDIRSAAYSITQQIGKAAEERDVRQKAVYQLIKACSDKNSGNVSMTLNFLTTYKTSDFSTQARDAVPALLYSKPPHLDKVFRLIGFLEVSSVIRNLRFYTTPGNDQGERWAAIISLARMNDPTAIQDMMTRVQKLPVNDDVVQTIFPDLVYTRQKAAIDYLIQALKSNEKNCASANPNSDEKIVCGYRIMEMLAPAINGYPLELDASGDIKTDNYKEALATVRAWFDDNKDYEINRDTF